MDTNSNIPAEKKVLSVEILHLDELGYGPQGKYTRREWRAECLKNLLAGKEQFESWQISLLNGQITTGVVSYGLNVDDLEVRNGINQLLAPITLDYSGHLFQNFVNAKSLHFKFPVNFTYATFIKLGWFEHAVFEKHVYFSGASFNADAWFEKATFCTQALFENITFNSYTMFKGANFRGYAWFRGASFKGYNEFNLAIFESESNFENAKFENVGHFELVQFKTATPKFRGCIIGETRLEFDGDSYFPQDEKSFEAIKNISFLKRLADEHGQTDQALNFNAMELRAKSKQSTSGLTFKVVSNLYEVVSDYGRSFAKPLFWYVALICLSVLFAMIYSTYSESPPEDQQVLCKPIKDQPPPLKLSYGRAVAEYAMFRAGGLMDFTDTGKQNNAVNCRLFEEPIEPPLMRAWGIFKGIASIALLFLAALGLRNKYRIK
jgi:uncharacterized protein YjbI with pentapeptide repeats